MQRQKIELTDQFLQKKIKVMVVWCQIICLQTVEIIFFIGTYDLFLNAQNVFIRYGLRTFYEQFKNLST